MIRNSISLPEVLIGFETTLAIDYSEVDIHKLINKTITKLENQYAVNLSRGVEEAAASNRFVNDVLDVFLTQLRDNLKSMALLTCVSVYDKQYGETLADYDYLGFAKESLQAALKYLQDDDLYKSRGSFMPALIERTGRIQQSSIKRLLTILVVLEALDVKEGVAIIAQYLYLGGM